jgi:hypothetical protein
VRGDLAPDEMVTGLVAEACECCAERNAHVSLLYGWPLW